MLRDLRPHLRHVAGRRRALAALFALGLLASATALAAPLLGRAFVDAVSSRSGFVAVPRIALALVGLGVADLLLGALARHIHARLSASVLADLRGELFESCLRAPLDRIEALRHGDLLTRFGSDLPRIEVLVVDGLLGAAQHLVFLAVAAAVLLELSPPLALWSFAGLALALAAAAAFRRPVEGRAAEVRGAMASVSHFLAERLSALRPIRFHRTEAEERERLSKESERLSRAVVRHQVLDAAAGGAPGLLLTLSLAWIYLLGGGLLESGEITLGTFVAFVLYQGRLFSPAQGILALVRNLHESRVSLVRVGEVLAAAPRRDGAIAAGGGAGGTGSAGGPRDGSDPAARSRGLPARREDGSGTERVARRGAAVLLEDVTFAYPGRTSVLRGVNLRLHPGERVALFGASGAGKSTLVQLLFGLRTPASGKVLVAGLAPGVDAGLRHVLGYAGAEPFLLHASVEDNVRYGNPGATAESVARALRLAEAEALVEGLPEGPRTVIGGRGLSLSDGQRQRIGLARLFLRDPEILVLDEAFSALDLETEGRVRKNLWRAFPGRTAVVVSHRPVGLEELDRILLLHDGRLTLADPALLGRMQRGDRERPRAAGPWAAGGKRGGHLR